MDSVADYEVRTCVRDWMLRVEQHDPGLYRHSVGVGDLVLRFSAHLGYSPADCLVLQTAGMLHDIGKLNIARSVLQKPGNLSLDEIDLMQRHAHDGYQMLVSQAQYDQGIFDVVRDHHERLDGTGYPYGILAPAISTEVRMVTLCDVYLAMTEPRPYGIRYNRVAALERMAIKRDRLDQRLLNAFGEMILQIDAGEAAYRISYTATQGPVKIRI